MVDLVIRHGTVVTGSKTFDGGVAIDGGRIVVVAESPALPAGRREITARGRLILPGLVDPHTHPGNYRPFDDDIRSETRAAAAGGVTTMLGTVKCTRMGGPFKEEATPDDLVSYLEVGPLAAEIVEREAFVDVGFSFMVITRQHAEEIPRCVERLGVTSFKFFAGSQGTSPWGRRVGMPIFPDEGTLFCGFRRCAASGAMVMIHAENRQVTAVLAEEVRAAGGGGLAEWEAHSPDFLEGSEIHAWSYFARRLGVRLYVVHLTSALGVQEVQAARARGGDVVGETCPQYLVLGADRTDPPSALEKFSPPTRSRNDREVLWDALASGVVNCTGTDHFAMRRVQKMGEGDIWSALPGGPGLETLLPLLMTEGVAAGRLSLERLVQVASEQPARAFGLYPRKGGLHVGADADVIIVDPDRERRVVPDDLTTWSDFSPFEGMMLRGWPDIVILRGRVIVEDGELVGAAGGRYLRREAVSAPRGDPLTASEWE